MTSDPFDTWQTGFVDIEPGRLHYYRYGKGPAVVLLHGLCDNARCWGDLARHLAESFDVVTYDARGHGLSFAADGKYGYAHQAGDLTRLIEELELEKPALVGHSMGAGTAAVYAASGSGLVSRLVLEEPAWRLQADIDVGPTPEQAAYIATVIAARNGPLADRVSAIKSQSPSWRAEEAERCAAAERQVNETAFHQIMESDASPEEWLNTASKLRAPTLVVAGNSDRGGILRQEVQDLVSDANPAIQFARYSDAGHCVRRDVGVAYRDLVSGFLVGTT